jgi:hypothetical protein
MAELGNLTARIVLPPRRMSTVKIRAGSLFRTHSARIGAAGAVFARLGWVFLRPPQPAGLLHRMYTGCQPFRLAQNRPAGAKSK